MSNYHSQIRNYGQPQSVFDANTAIQVLGYKQQKYDANAARIQEALNTYGNIDLARDEDKEYLYEKLNALTSSIKGMRGADLGSENITSQIMAHVSQAMDERVMKQYGNTQKLRKFEADLQERIKRNPDAWNETNYTFALQQAGYYDYMDPNKDVDDLGQLTYRDYVDAQAEMRDISNNLDKFVNVKKVTTPQGFYFVTEQSEELSKEQVRRIAEQQLSDRAKGQLEIDAWATYEQNMSPEDLNDRFSRYSERRLESIDATIAKKELELGGASNEEEREAITEDIKQWREYRDNMALSFNNASARAKAVHLHQEDFYGGFANTFYKDPKNILTREFSTNQAAIAQAKMEAAAAAREEEPTESTMYPVPQAHNRVEGLKNYDDALRRLEDTEQSFRQGARSAVQQIKEYDAEYGTNYSELIQKVLDDSSIEDKELALTDELIKLAKNNPEALGGLDFIQNLEGQMIEYNQLSKDVAMVREQAWEDTEERAIRELYSEAVDGRKTIIHEDGSEETYKQFFEKNGIESYEDLNSNENVKNKLLSSYYADKIVSGSYTTNRRSRVGALIRDVYNMWSNPMNIFAPIHSVMQNIKEDEDKKVILDRMENLIGEEKAIELIEHVRNKRNVIHENSMIGGRKFVSGSLLNGATDKLVDSKMVNETANRIAAQEGTKLSRGVDHIIAPDNIDGSLYQATRIFIESPSTAEAYGEDSWVVNKDRSITVRQIDKDHVEFSFTHMGTKGGEPISKKLTKKISVTQLPPGLHQRLNLEMGKSTITAQTFPNIKSEVKFYDGKNKNKTYVLSRDILKSADENAADVYTYQNVKDHLFNTNKHINGTYDNPTELGVIMKGLLESKDITVRPYKSHGRVYIEIYKGDRNIFQDSRAISEQNIPTTYSKMRYMPEIYVSHMMDIMMQEYAATGGGKLFDELKNIRWQ